VGPVGLEPTTYGLQEPSGPAGGLESSGFPAWSAVSAFRAVGVVLAWVRTRCGLLQRSS